VSARTVFSGIQPTGSLTLGNYLGAIRAWVDLQGQEDCVFSIVDLHALTMAREAAALRHPWLDFACLCLACGLDPRACILFLQSQVPAQLPSGAPMKRPGWSDMRVRLRACRVQSLWERKEACMPELSQLSHAEKVFFAGCIRTVMLADGNIQEAELKDLESIYRKLDFHDYEECLDEFEEKSPDEAAFLKEAAKIANPAAQDLILSTLYELTVQNGAPEDAQEGIFMKLTRLWEKG